MGVVQQKLVNQNEPAGLKNRNRLFDDGATTLRAHAVKNLRQPRDVIGPLDGIRQVISCLEVDPRTQPEPSNGLLSKGLCGEKIEHGGSEVGIGLAKVNRIGSRASTQVEKMSPLGE